MKQKLKEEIDKIDFFELAILVCFQIKNYITVVFYKYP